MIRRMLKVKGSMVKFGTGTVKVAVYRLKSRFGGQCELTQISRAKVGDAYTSDPLPKTEKVVLDFSSIQSLDVLIEQLQSLREEILEG